MIAWKPAIYVMMACAFGACAEEPCDNQSGSSSCVCKPTMKLDMTPLDSAHSICNNATFDWMVHTMLVEVSTLKQKLNDQTFDAQKYKDEADHLALKNTELNNLLKRSYEQTDDAYRKLDELQSQVDEQHVEKAKALAANNDAQNEIISLRNDISDLNTVLSRMEQEKKDLMAQIGELSSINQQKKLASDCSDIQKDGARFSGVFTVYPSGDADEPTEVFCDLHTDNGGWTVIQRRQDGSQRFDKDWQTYKNGFGTIAKEFWIGNEMVHRLTNDKEYELRIDMTDSDGNIGYAFYQHFSVGSEANNYMLYVSGYSGTSGDSMTHHDHNPFSTVDVDNDKSRSGHCSKLFGDGGWWFVRCYDSNLNGQYGTNDKTGIIWFHWQKEHVSLKHVEMKIRPAKFASN